jgi:hypothetical protein
MAKERRQGGEGTPAGELLGLANPGELGELAELAALRSWLQRLPRGELNRLADDCPRRIPPKQRRHLPESLFIRWLEPDVRRFLQGALRQAFLRLIEAVRRDGVRALPPLLASFSEATVLWVCLEAGVPPERALRQLARRGRGRLAAEVDDLVAVREGLRQRREVSRARLASEREKAMAKSRRAAKALRWQAERAEAKRVQAERTIGEQAREVERLRRELAEARTRIAALEEERRILLDQLAEEARRPSPPEPPSSPRPLTDRLVLVVGDEGRQADYRQLVTELGGRFEFLSGFGSPPLLLARARAADLVLFITAYASHKMWAAAKRAETPVVPVNQAGVRALRDALLRHLHGGPDPERG